MTIHTTEKRAQKLLALVREQVTRCLAAEADYTHQHKPTLALRWREKANEWEAIGDEIETAALAV